MQTKAFSTLTLPALGLGCMRLPTDEKGEIRTEETERMIDYALANGVNYFDTGYDYHGGNSEKALGSILSRYARESYFLADKFPGYNPRKWKKVEEVFEEQLTRCQTPYFDFYLFHNVSELNIDAYLDPKYGIFDYLYRQKEEGRIRYLGFSVHGDTRTTQRFLQAYGDKMDFAQIQLNYIDYEFQRAKEKLELLTEYRIPVWVMEPLRGGKLANPMPLLAEKLSNRFQDRRPHELAFRFLQSIPEVALVLSGMSNFAQVQDNIRIFEQNMPLSEQEVKDLLLIASQITAIGTCPCTGCGYCLQECPQQLDIPKLISYYNEHTFSGGGFIVPSAVVKLDKDKRPSACVGCRSCERICPQKIQISDVLAKLSRTLNLTK